MAALTRFSQNLLTFTPKWHLVDAKNQPAGRVAVQIAHILMGKHKPIFHPSANVGDHVVVINAGQVAFTGRKWTQKLYRYHTMYPGGLKETEARHLLEKKPTEIVRKAVYGMLPKNSLRMPRMQHLHIFEGDQHPFTENIAGNILPPVKIAGKTRGAGAALPLQIELLEVKL